MKRQNLDLPYLPRKWYGNCRRRRPCCRSP